jgi:hypothetical protein
MVITNLDSLQRRQEMNDRIRARQNRLNPLFGQQQQKQLLQPSMSIPMGGFMGQNKIGGQSGINIYKAPQPKLTPEELEAQQLEDRAAQYQKELNKFNLGQKEAELGKRRAEAEEIASGRFMLDGQAVTRAEMDRYTKNAKQTAAKFQAENPVDPLYVRAKQFVNENFSQVRPKMPGESQEQYQRRVDYHNNNTRVKGENVINRVYNQMKENALIRSIQQFSNDPTAYLMGGNAPGQRTNTLSPDELMNYLQRANQMFQISGKEGNFMDDLLGRSGGIQKRVVKPLSSLLMERTADEQADIDYFNEARYMSKYRADVESGRISDHLNLLEKDKRAARIKLSQEGKNLSPSEMRNLLNTINAKTLKVKY